MSRARLPWWSADGLPFCTGRGRTGIQRFDRIEEFQRGGQPRGPRRGGGLRKVATRPPRQRRSMPCLLTKNTDHRPKGSSKCMAIAVCRSLYGSDGPIADSLIQDLAPYGKSLPDPRTARVFQDSYVSTTLRWACMI